MKRITIPFISAAALVCLLALGPANDRQGRNSILAPQAHAQEAPNTNDDAGAKDTQDEGQRNNFDQGRTRSCSTGILRGRYGLLLTGTIVGLGPAAEIGSITFDGAGKLSGTLTASFNGQSLPRTATGTYVVNPDCTGTIAADITPGGPINLNLVTVDAAGRKALLIVTTPGLVFSGSIETQ